jgi:asparagine synthase (glutamine-hydrolysing)
MCGILGYVDSARGPGAWNLEQAVAAQHHRGPDDSGIWRDGGIGLGFVRLAIIDLSPAGHQPMVTGDGRYTIVFNGEIYNFPELRSALEAEGERFVGHSDTEILLRLFQKIGFEACLAKLRGMFAFAVWDRKERRLSLARDRLGVKPLVYAETADGFVFASEIGGLFAMAPSLSRRVDPTAIDHYLTYQYVPSPRTGFAAIRKLPPAHAMVVHEGRIERCFRYWDIDHSRRSSLSFDEAAEALREQVLEATRLRMVADVPLGAFLSGGVDSSITVAAMARQRGDAIRTYAIGFEDEKLNELPYAREVARHLGTEHHEAFCRPDAVELLPRLIGQLGEPFADNSILPTYYVAEFARRDVTVALTGDGGDESFAGYRRHLHLDRVDRLQRRGLLPLWRGLRRTTVALENSLRKPGRRRPFPHGVGDQILDLAPLERLRHLVAYFPERDKAGLLAPAFRDLIEENSLAPLEAAWARSGMQHDSLNRWLYTDSQTYLPDDILAKVDIASMAVSLECRSPFLDHRVVEFAASLPAAYKLGPRGRSKHLLKAAFADWFPPGFLDRKKMGFSAPTGRWLREDLQPMLRQYLLGSSPLQAWLQPAKVGQLVEAHLSGRASHAKQLWSLLCLALWIERFGVEA